MHDILAVEYSATSATAGITVRDPGNGKQTLVRSQDVLLFKISNSPGDMETPTVADVFFAEWSGGIALEKLKDAGWGWTVPDFPETIYQCHVEGGIVLDIFSFDPFSIE
jgi:hypothetical protein